MQTKAERKRLRKQYRALAAKYVYEKPPHTGQEKLPPRWSRDFLELHLKAARENFFIASSMTTNLDCSVASLEKLDHELPRSLSGELESLGRRVDSNTLWALHAGLGAYFGEMLAKNLGGKWHYPARIHTIFAWFLRRSDLLYRHWYVVVGKQKVPVFEIAYRRETLGRERASLARAYEEIAGACTKLGQKKDANP